MIGQRCPRQGAGGQGDSTTQLGVRGAAPCTWGMNFTECVRVHVYRPAMVKQQQVCTWHGAHDLQQLTLPLLLLLLLLLLDIGVTAVISMLPSTEHVADAYEGVRGEPGGLTSQP